MTGKYNLLLGLLLGMHSVSAENVSVILNGESIGCLDQFQVERSPDDNATSSTVMIETTECLGQESPIKEFDLSVTGDVGCYSDPGPPDDPLACPPAVDDPPVCDSSFSDPDCPRAPYYHDGLDQNRDYDKKIEPQQRHVYKFRVPTQEETRTEMNGEDKNRIMEFSVVDNGIEVLVKLGVSLVKGRTDAVPGEDDTYCFSGPGSEAKVTVATNDKYTTCNIDFSKENEPNYYYFTIESTDKTKTGGYRFVFRAGAMY